VPLLLPIVCGSSTTAHAYIEGGTPTLGKLTNDAVHIVVLQVDKVNLEKRVILFNKMAEREKVSRRLPAAPSQPVGSK
jgi:hypothetical protein